MENTLNLIQNMVYEQYWAAKKRVARPFNKHENWRNQAKLIPLSREAKGRLEQLIFYETKSEYNAQLTCRHFAIPPKTFYKWKKRFDDRNLRSLEDRNRAPKRKRQKEITFLEESRVIKLRKEHILWGKKKLKVVYEREHGESISSWKIQYTIQKYKLYPNPAKNAKIQAKRKRNQAKKRITELKKQPFPGFLVALDCLVIYWSGLKRYVLTGIDEVGKIAFARMYTTKSSRSASDFLQRMFYLLDGNMPRALHDNGSEFHKEFKEACHKLEVKQYWSRVKTPTDNAINERFNGTLRREFINRGNFHPDPRVFNHNLTEWLVEYNFERPHESLGQLTPWEFTSRTPNVLPMYSSRTIA